MSLLTLPLRKDAYLVGALGEFVTEARGSGAVRSSRAREGEYLAGEAIDAIDLHVAALEALHSEGAQMDAAEWTEHETRLNGGLSRLIREAQALLSQTDLSEQPRERLRKHLEKVEYEVRWSVGEAADAPAFEQMVAESERAYAAGGWDE